ncbi:MBL fold metallo-hydrolase [Clostridium ganghwense]|uniref:MBL fold metallo-hydrolase n=1 Tax=Clostridium ganghwense TaxID=312089 RepID=A0ABT4CK83_9CLOT|nr:MBL fold metallo-hydrolase [Clostridium ganghwense]MCY6369457.1 MBL fold metallo-hydrolase [Clostridium ganghwense]
MNNNLKLEKITQNIYYMLPVEETDRPMLAIIMGKERALIVDAGNSDAHAKEFLEEIEKLNPPKEKYLAITHWHWDHVFGIAYMGMRTFAHEYTKTKVKELIPLDWSDEALDKRVEEGTEIEFCADKIKVEFKEPRCPNIKVPDITFKEGVEMDLGDITCRIDHVGGEHSRDSSVIYVPEDRVLFIGDCLFVDIYNGKWSWTTKELFPLIDKLLAYDVDYYIESHADDPIPREEMIIYTERLKEIGKVVDEIGDNKNLILERLSQQFNEALSEDDILAVEWYICGILKKS